MTCLYVPRTGRANRHGMGVPRTQGSCLRKLYGHIARDKFLVRFSRGVKYDINSCKPPSLSENPQMRDSDGGYFAWSAGIFAFACVLWSITSVSSDVGGGVALWAARTMLGGVISTAVIYLVGRQLGGNGSWKAVFSVVFYAHVYMAPMAAAVAALVFLTTGLTPLGFLDGLGLTDVGISETGPNVSVALDLLGFLAVLIVVIVVFLVWGTVLWIKAVKTVNGFGTAKAFGLIILGGAASLVTTLPLSV